eukprot:CAMPEP_0119122132 /NCGR_PEP_ID=MMETSP1310-20130426/2477_1 /TAXON_ID=464262 /ORGANISM="Genus nov. species nov., Strain RCC2339" /LENGTH=205 /DNA_ID=CAMNT_0007111743 /DNA_START=397 /DNA_END=1014 /DNA_ORIENTATION=-
MRPPRRADTGDDLFTVKNFLVLMAVVSVVFVVLYFVSAPDVSRFNDTPSPSEQYEKFCKYVSTDGKYVYNLNSIRAQHMGEPNRVEADGMEYYWDLCVPVVDGGLHPDFDTPCPDNALICQRTTQGGTDNCGGYPVIPGDSDMGTNMGVSLRFTQGTKGCDGVLRQTIIHVNCGEDEVEPTFFEDPPCTYHITYETPGACPIKEL